MGRDWDVKRERERVCVCVCRVRERQEDIEASTSTVRLFLSQNSGVKPFPSNVLLSQHELFVVVCFAATVQNVYRALLVTLC